MKGPISLDIARRLETLSSEEKEAVEDFVIDTVDGALNDFLWMMEQHEEFDLVGFHESESCSLRDISDGLSVDYWNFVEEHSQYKQLHLKFEFNPYSSRYPELFSREKKRLASNFEGEIEHVGSTAVEGLGGSEIIDIAIAVEDVEQTVNVLQKLYYHLMPQCIVPDSICLSASRPDEQKKQWEYRVYLLKARSHRWHELIAFRDCLHKSYQMVQAYNTFKQSLLIEAGMNSDKYDEKKRAYIRTLLVENKIQSNPPDNSEETH